MRPSRIPFTFPQSLPLSFSHSIVPGTRRVELKINAPEEWSAALLDGLSMLTEFTRMAKRELETGYRAIRIQDIHDDVGRKYQCVRSTYHDLRASGCSHRAAVHRMVHMRRLPFFRQWDFADYNWCVRAVAPSSPPALRPVPKKAKPTRRTEAGGHCRATS